MKKILLTALTILLASFTNISMASAAPGDVSVSINPSSQEIVLEPGGHYDQTLTVYNVGAEAFDFSVGVVPYQVKNEKYEPDFATQNSYTKLTNWINFEETKYHLEPNRSVSVKYSIDVPQGVPGGGQYAAITIRTIDEATQGGSVSILAQLASIIHGHVRGAALREEGRVIDRHFPSFMLGSGFHLSASFENTGNIDFRATESMTIRDFFTGREIVLPETTTSDGLPVGATTAIVLPGTRRTIDLYWREAPQLGLFKVTHNVYFLNESFSDEHLVFLCPVWLLVLVSIIIIMIIIGVISAVHNRKQNKMQVY